MNYLQKAKDAITRTETAISIGNFGSPTRLDAQLAIANALAALVERADSLIEQGRQRGE